MHDNDLMDFDSDPVRENGQPKLENWNYHVLRIVLLQGKGKGFEPRVVCKGADKDDCACTETMCWVSEHIYSNGLWDILSAAGEIEFTALSARMNWSDYEEPWVEVEP